MINYLKGKKSYILAIGGIVYALLGYFTGHLDANSALNLVFGSMGLSTLRAGISNAITSQG